VFSSSAYSSILKMEATCSSETSVDFQLPISDIMLTVLDIRISYITSISCNNFHLYFFINLFFLVIIVNKHVNTRIPVQNNLKFNFRTFFFFFSCCPLTRHLLTFL
jgi:hypothetical protein